VLYYTIATLVEVTDINTILSKRGEGLCFSS